MAPTLPNKPLLPESQWKGAGASRAHLGAESSSPRHGLQGPATVKAAVKRPGEALPFHVAKGEGRSGGKAKPAGGCGAAGASGCLPRRGTMGWVGRVPASPLQRPFLPQPPHRGRDRKAAGTASSAPVWDSRTKQKPLEEKGGRCRSSPPCGAEPLPQQPLLQHSKHSKTSPAMAKPPVLGSHRPARVPGHAGGTCP